MSDWPGIDGEITSHSNLKLSVSRGSWGGDRGYFLLVIINCLASNVKTVFSHIFVWISVCVSNLCPGKHSSIYEAVSLDSCWMGNGATAELTLSHKFYLMVIYTSLNVWRKEHLQNQQTKMFWS